MENNTSGVILQFILGRFPLARKSKLRTEDNLLESGVVDSMGVLDLVGFLESSFSITVTDDELTPENFQTVDSVARFVTGKRSTGGAS